MVTQTVALVLLAALVGLDATVDHWVVLVNTSRYWLNYRLLCLPVCFPTECNCHRHSSNVLLMYRELRRLGYDDNHIIFFNAECVACDPRNPVPGSMYADSAMDDDLYPGVPPLCCATDTHDSLRRHPS
jgi:phosphatidylinositol glycan class K